ncbi:hypothetical protein DICPUDRAFT_85931 [Dictyostelium purpureum]|uniref:NmrA-like domain-containing protein n=1 Tax=Dictyostelium purpureum TaxID=5786 RepID=F0Z8C1_DICPU|nr:uncharacterized protein DICPUDRAFT_85931 [Dictyostelium purpureum]EGC39811.1 hypothetical protein DICPUDRAFT_85931 [Dictyostelium purpureum]|eukprot:XP_003283678.1 hypothetical protein DICPUDRAFT_85931 [Dictyostelium purpureum]
MTKLISVLNGTGLQGGSVVRELIKDGFKVKTFTRNLNSNVSKELRGLGVEVIEYDFEEKSKEEIAQVLQGSYGVYLVTLTPYTKNEVEYGVKVADASLLAGTVKHIVFSTLPNTMEITGGKVRLPDFENKYEIEKHIRQISKKSNDQFVSSFVSAPMYHQNFQTYYPPAKTQGDSDSYSITLPGKPDLKLDYGDINDIGKLVSEQFKNPAKYSGIIVPLSSDELTGDQVAEIFSKVTGKKVVYNYIPTTEYRKSNDLEAGTIADMFDYYNEFSYFPSSFDKTIAKNITKLTNLEEFLRTINFKLE